MPMAVARYIAGTCCCLSALTMTSSRSLYMPPNLAFSFSLIFATCPMLSYTYSPKFIFPPWRNPCLPSQETSVAFAVPLSISSEAILNWYFDLQLTDWTFIDNIAQCKKKHIVSNFWILNWNRRFLGIKVKSIVWKMVLMVLINWKDIDYQIRVKSVFLAVKPLPKRKIYS